METTSDYLGLRECMSHSSNSLKGGFIGDYLGEYYGGH